MFTTIKEGGAKFSAPLEKKISKKLPVFYNPVMAFNRDMSILLLKALERKGLKVGDPLAGTGVRGLRFLKELPEGTIQYLFMNDYNPRFKDLVVASLKENGILAKKTGVHSFFSRQEKIRTTDGFQEGALDLAFTAYNNEVLLSSIDANLFLLLTPGFDYIDIDPFGSPNPFLDAAAMRLARGGILAVTATDTSALCGTHQSACRRKYWADPMHNELMHEMGLRILIRKVQLVAAAYDKALLPLFSYDRDHYMRVFLFCEKGKAKVDAVLRQNRMFSFAGQIAGPLWTGRLWDADFVGKMRDLAVDKKSKKFLSILAEEAKVPAVGFFDIHAMVKRHQIKDIPRTRLVMERLRAMGRRCAYTHFSETGIRTDATAQEFVDVISCVDTASH